MPSATRRLETGSEDAIEYRAVFLRLPDLEVDTWQCLSRQVDSRGLLRMAVQLGADGLWAKMRWAGVDRRKMKWARVNRLVRGLDGGMLEALVDEDTFLASPPEGTLSFEVVGEVSRKIREGTYCGGCGVRELLQKGAVEVCHLREGPDLAVWNSLEERAKVCLTVGEERVNVFETKPWDGAVPGQTQARVRNA